MIDSLREKNTIKEIIEEIKNFYKAYDNNNYIPGIYKEGSLLSSSNKYADYYAKLIIRPINHKLTNSWTKGNLEGNFIDGSYEINESACIYNLITLKKFYKNEIYTLNPCLYEASDYIYEKIQDNKNVCNLVYFNSTFSTHEWPVLISEKNDDNNILVLKRSIADYVNNKPHIFPQYKLSVEFEYRDKVHIISETKDISSDSYYIHNTTADDRTNLVGTIDLNLVIPILNDLDIMVNSIDGSFRKINESNWNDDVDAGLIVFDKKCLTELKMRYIFVEYHMIDLFNQNSSLVDIINNRVVFWEGEFNQLPYDIKKSLEKYNIKKPSTGIISKPMFEWQLNANIDYDKYEYPYQKLSKYLYENYYNILTELKCNMDLPNNKNEFVERINNVLKILNLNIDDIEKNELGYTTIIKILTTKYLSTKKELIELFDYFSYNILEVISNDK